MKEIATTKPKTRRKFDRNFKREAVTLWLNSGKSAREISEQLGILERQLYDWKAARVVASTPAGDLEAENATLRRELALVREQRDILKKTLGIISEPTSNATNGSRR
jgi:transposase